MLVRKVANILEENNFNLQENEDTKDLDLIYYKREYINIFLGNHNYNSIKFENVNYMSKQLRNILLDHCINLSNSYLVYCVEDGGIKEEDMILLERSNNHLRKYIIREIEDIDRIFILKDLSNESNIQDIFQPSINKDIKILIDEMIDNEKILKLDQGKIDLIVHSIMNNLGDKNED